MRVAEKLDWKGLNYITIAYFVRKYTYLSPTISAGDSFFFVNFRDFLAKASELQERSLHKYVVLLN
jgi:hypothetical protein